MIMRRGGLKSPARLKIRIMGMEVEKESSLGTQNIMTRVGCLTQDFWKQGNRYILMKRNLVVGHIEIFADDAL